MYAEIRLRNGTNYATATVLRNAASLTFGAVNGDVGAISFTLPYADAQSLVVGANSVVEVMPNGATAPNMWFEIDGSQVTQTVDGASLYQFSGKSILQWFNDGIVYPSTWNDPLHNLDQYTVSTSGTVTTTIPKVSAANQVQTVTIFGAPTGGTFTLTYNGTTSSNLAYNISVANLTTAINTITGATGSSVIGTAGVSYSVTIPSSIASPKLMTAASSLTGGSTPSVTVVPSSSLTANTTIAGYSFQNATPGFILRTLVARCVERGGFGWLDVSSFSGPTDSAGTAWPSNISTTYATGTTLLQVVQDLISRQLIDFKLVGTSLYAYVRGTQSTHYSADQITFRRGLHITEQTRTVDASDGATVVLIQGDEASIEEVSDTSLITALGRRREKFVSQSGITDLPTLALIANAQLAISGHIQTEDTLGTTDQNILPWINYQLGDWVWADFDGTLKNIQIQQISATQQDAGNLQIGLTLGDLLMSRDEKNQLLLDAIIGGNGSLSNGPPTQKTNNVPSAPSGLTANTAAYRDANGIDYSQVTLSWVAPTTNTDGTTLTDLDHYEIRYQVGSAATWTLAANVPGSTSPTAAYLSGLPSGQSFTSQIRAVDAARNASLWNTQSNLVTNLPTYTGTLAQPSTPSVTPIIQGFTVSWNGLDYQGNAYDKSFSQVNIYVSTNSSFTPDSTTLIGSFTSRGGTQSFSGYTYGTTYYVKFIAYDKSSNFSLTSAVSSGVVPVKAGSGDVTGVGGNNTYTSSTAPTGANTNDLWINTSNNNAVYVYNGSSWVLYQFGQGSIAANSISAANIVSGGLTASVIATGSLSSATITITTGGYINIGTPGQNGIQMSASGFTAWNANAQTFNLSSSGVLSLSGAFTGGSISGTTITGTTIVGGTVRTSNSTPYIIMGVNSADNQTLEFHDGSYLSSISSTPQSGGSSVFALNGPGGKWVNGSGTYIAMLYTGIYINTNGGGINLTGNIVVSGTAQVNSNLTVYGTTNLGSSSQLTITSGGYLSTTNSLYASTNVTAVGTVYAGNVSSNGAVTGGAAYQNTNTGTGNLFMVQNSTGNIGVGSNTTNSFLLLYVGGAVRAALGNTGNFTISGTLTQNGSPSSLRYKTDIVSHSVTGSLVDRIRMVSFNYKTDVNELYPTTRQHGVIAEELASDSELDDYVFYNEDKAEGVKYDILALAAVMSLNKKLEERCATIEARLDKLEKV